MKLLTNTSIFLTTFLVTLAIFQPDMFTADFGSFLKTVAMFMGDTGLFGFVFLMVVYVAAIRGIKSFVRGVK